MSPFVAMLIGLSLVIASGCVFNNYLDRGIDKKMARTKKRALVSGAISSRATLIFGSTLGVMGIVTLAKYTNLTATVLAFTGFIFYVIVYGVAKRKSLHGTVIGSISGAVPPVVGYTAVSGQIDMAAVLLFLILTFWQMPHFYAIAIYRSKDYASAGIPVLPLVKSMRAAKIQSFIYIFALILAVIALTTLDYTGYTYLTAVVAVCAGWIFVGLRGYKNLKDEAWGKIMFRYSLIVILILSLMISLGARLP